MWSGRMKKENTLKDKAKMNQWKHCSFLWVCYKCIKMPTCLQTKWIKKPLKSALIRCSYMLTAEMMNGRDLNLLFKTVA